MQQAVSYPASLPIVNGAERDATRNPDQGMAQNREQGMARGRQTHTCTIRTAHGPVRVRGTFAEVMDALRQSRQGGRA